MRTTGIFLVGQKGRANGMGKIGRAGQIIHFGRKLINILVHTTINILLFIIFD